MTNPNSAIVQAAHGPSTPAPLSSLAVRELVDDSSKYPTFWIVEAQAREQWFDNSGGGLDVPSQQAIDGFELRSGLIAKLTWTLHTGRSLYFDLGATLRLCVFARTVQFAVCGPTGQDGLRDAVPGRLMVRGPRVSITRVDAQAYPTNTCVDVGKLDGCEVYRFGQLLGTPSGTLGPRQGRLTLRQRVVGGGPAPTVQIPVGVTDMQIFSVATSPGPAPNAPWTWLDRLSDPIGAVPIVNGSSARVFVPGPARAIRLSAGPVNDVTFTLAFGLEW